MGSAAEEEKQGKAKKGRVEWLLQGTLYPDVIESISFKGPSATIKTHHNVGGLLKDMKLKLIEPLRELFKGAYLLNPPIKYYLLMPILYPDEVRALGRLLSIPAPLVQRHPFPGPGLAIRILGPVTREQVKILQHADSITSRKSAKRDFTTRLARRSRSCYLLRLLVSWAIRGRTSRFEFRSYFCVSCLSGMLIVALCRSLHCAPFNLKIS